MGKYITSDWRSDMRSLLTAWFLLALIVVLWLWLVLVKAPIILPVSLVAMFRESDRVLGKVVNWKGWRYNLWIGDDQNVNTILGGNLDITISSRIGFNAERGNKVALHMEPVVNWLFRLTIGQENHCRASIEHDETHHSGIGA